MNGDQRLAAQVWYTAQVDITGRSVATIAGDCLLDCGPVLLNFGSLHDQIYGV